MKRIALALIWASGTVFSQTVFSQVEIKVPACKEAHFYKGKWSVTAQKTSRLENCQEVKDSLARATHIAAGPVLETPSFCQWTVRAIVERPRPLPGHPIGGITEEQMLWPAMASLQSIALLKGVHVECIERAIPF